MYQYKYIPVDTGGGFLVWHPGAPGAHRQIRRRGMAVYRIFSGELHGHGGISQVDLIFERES